MITHYAHLNSGKAIFIKDKEIFTAQKGLTEEWGREWVPIHDAANADHAYKKADQLFRDAGLKPEGPAATKAEQPEPHEAAPVATGWIIDKAESFQEGVANWMAACFTPGIITDKEERCDRLIEEVLELVQSCGYDMRRVAPLVQYVANRPCGEPSQEAGGVLVTLAALLNCIDVDMNGAGDEELGRIWRMIPQIRAKHASKPTGSALPMPVEPGADMREQHPKEYETILHVLSSPAVDNVTVDDLTTTLLDQLGYMGAFDWKNKQWTVGEQTMALVFKPAGLNSLYDLQAFLNQVEKVLISANEFKFTAGPLTGEVLKGAGTVQEMFDNIEKRMETNQAEDAAMLKQCVEGCIRAFGGNPDAFVSENGHTVRDLTMFGVLSWLKATGSPDPELARYSS